MLLPLTPTSHASLDRSALSLSDCPENRSRRKPRARIEQTIGKLKRFKRVALRCEKTDISYAAIISFACGLMLVKSVHTAQCYAGCCAV